MDGVVAGFPSDIGCLGRKDLATHAKSWFKSTGTSGSGHDYAPMDDEGEQSGTVPDSTPSATNIEAIEELASLILSRSEFVGKRVIHGWRKSMDGLSPKSTPWYNSYV